jgi:hypothetical protein
MLSKNMGGIDRLSRVGLGAALVASAILGALGSWAYIGVLAMATGALGRCPLYAMFNYSTFRPPSRN